MVRAAIASEPDCLRFWDGPADVVSRLSGADLRLLELPEAAAGGAKLGAKLGPEYGIL
jgi:hypothetical protein